MRDLKNQHPDSQRTLVRSPNRLAARIRSERGLRKNVKWVGLVVVGVLAAALYGGTGFATPQSGVTTTPIATKISFGEIDVKADTDPADIWQARLKTQGLSDAYVVDNKFAPVDPTTGAVATTGWHSHPGPSLIMIVAGTVTNYDGDDPTCTGHPYSAGEGFVDSGEDEHMLRNEGTLPAETIAVQLLPKDAPRKIDAPVAPGNCPF